MPAPAAALQDDLYDGPDKLDRVEADRRSSTAAGLAKLTRVKLTHQHCALAAFAPANSTAEVCPWPCADQ